MGLCLGWMSYSSNFSILTVLRLQKQYIHHGIDPNEVEGGERKWGGRASASVFGRNENGSDYGSVSKYFLIGDSLVSLSKFSIVTMSFMFESHTF